jgi:hypothetical protein
VGGGRGTRLGVREVKGVSVCGWPAWVIFLPLPPPALHEHTHAGTSVKHCQREPPPTVATTHPQTCHKPLISMLK